MSQLLVAGPILNLNNVNIHVNIWKTEAVDESSDGLLNHVSQGLTRNIKLEWCPINMSWFKGNAMRRVSVKTLRHCGKEETIKCVIFT